MLLRHGKFFLLFNLFNRKKINPIVTFEEATNKVKDFLKINIPGECEISLFEEYTIENNICWVFFYGNRTVEIAGNAPIIVDKEQGNIYVTGTGTDIKIYIKAFKKAYKRYGNDPVILESAMYFPEMYCSG